MIGLSTNRFKIPCYKCEDRHAECHSSCEKYREYSDRNKMARKKDRLNKAAADYHANQTVSKADAYSKHTGKRIKNDYHKFYH